MRGGGAPGERTQTADRISQSRGASVRNVALTPYSPAVGCNRQRAWQPTTIGNSPGIENLATKRAPGAGGVAVARQRTPGAIVTMRAGTACAFSPSGQSSTVNSSLSFVVKASI